VVSLAGQSFALAGEISIEDRLVALKQAYSGYVKDITPTHIVMRDGSTILTDDKRPKSFSEKLENADIEDMLSQVYPVVGCEKPGNPRVNFDPGRIRNERFFKAVYGHVKSNVVRKLVNVDWFGQDIKVNGAFGLPEKLAAVVEELRPNLATLKQFLVPSAGGFNWRPIAGTDRLSAHSFGIAIDISSAKTEYWRWAKSPAGAKLKARNVLPEEIVAAFERHGFIWGGKWYHFDTMHFEYRPELIEIGRLAKERGC